MSGQLIGRGYITIAGLKDGDPAKTYVLIPSVDSITKKLDGTLSVTGVTCSVYKVTGSSAYALTSDHTLSYVRTPDGAGGILIHAAGTSGSIAVLATTESIEFELKDGSKVIDRVRVPVLSDATDVNNELDTYSYLKEALAKQGTVADHGLLLTSLIALGYTDDNNVRHTLAGTNGIYVPKLDGRTIGSWWGGDMLDLFKADDTRKTYDELKTESGKIAPLAATSLVRMDGSAYFANGNIGFKADGSGWLGNENGIKWTPLGALTIGAGVTIDVTGDDGVKRTLTDVANFITAVTSLLAPADANGKELQWNQVAQAQTIMAKKTFFSLGGVSAKGIGSSTGGGGSVFGLYTDSTWAATPSTTDALGAVLGKSLHTRISALEGKNYLDELTLTEAGTGNAVTDVSLSNDKKTLTVTYGASYLSGITKAMVEGVLTGNITTHTHSQYLTSASLSGYYSKTQADERFQPKGNYVTNVTLNDYYTKPQIYNSPIIVYISRFVTLDFDEPLLPQSLGGTPTVLYDTVSKTLVAMSGYPIRPSITNSDGIFTNWVGAEGMGSVQTATRGWTPRSDVLYYNLQASEFYRWDGTDMVAVDELNDMASGGGLDESQLADYLTTNNYAKKSDIPSLSGYATQAWVTGKGYLTSSSLHTLTIQKNGTTVGTYKPNADATINIADVASAATLENHLNNTTNHVAGAEKLLWNQTATKLNAILGEDSDAIINKWEEVVAFLDTYTEADTLANLLSNKVDKVSGKGLSTNDFTDAYRDKLNGLTNYSLPTATETVKGGVKVGSGLAISAQVLSVNLSASHIPSLPWSKITSGKPTTLSGYGITDAKIENGVITLGDKSITPITSHQSIYPLEAVGGKFALKVNYLPSAAKATLYVPTHTSHLTNDSGFLTAHQSIHALTIKGNGTSLLVYDPKAQAAEIDITPAKIGASPSSHVHTQYAPVTALNSLVPWSKRTVAYTNGTNLNPQFINIENENLISGYTKYWSVINLGSYSGNNFRSQIAMPYQDSISDTDLFIRTANGADWQAWRKVLHDGNTKITNGTITINGTSITPLVQHQSLANYVTTNTAQRISGGKTFNNGALAVRQDKACGLTFYSFGDSDTERVASIEILGASGSWLKNSLDFYKSGRIVARNSFTATSIIKSGGTASQALMADGSVRGMMADGPINDSLVSDILSPLVTRDVLKGWDGSRILMTVDGQVHRSNLAYCNKGAFGDIVTHSHSEYVTALEAQGDTFVWKRGGTNHAITPYFATQTSVLRSQGRLTAVTNNTAHGVGVRLFEAYNNGYPTAYGNVLAVQGSTAIGGGELLMGWSGTNEGHASLYYRNRRDTASANWSPWATILDSVNFNSVIGSNLTAYVKKAGDTMTGTLTIGINAPTALAVFNQTGTNEPYIYLQRAGVYKAAFTHHSTHGTAIYNYPSQKYLGIKDDGTPHYNGNVLLHAGNYAATLDPRYVNVSGDTMTGALSFSLDNQLIKAIYNSTGSYSNVLWVRRSDATVIYGSPQWAKVVLETSGSCAYRQTSQVQYKIWDAGNDGAGSGLDADLLDGVQGVNYGYIRNAFNFTHGSARANITTAQFIETLTSLGAFSRRYWSVKCSWSYANNDIITDTGLGNIQLAGAVIEVISNSASEYTIRVTTSPTSTDGAATNAVFIYRNHGSGYAPNWKRLANTSDNVASATKLQTARKIFGVNFDGTADVSGTAHVAAVEISHPTPFIDFHFGSSTADYTSRIIETASGRLSIEGKLSIGYVNDSYKLATSSFICNSWVRTVGSAGWYSETYGGGWCMTDSTWIRNCGNKSLYMNSAIIRTDGELQVGGGGDKFRVTAAGAVTATSFAMRGGTAAQSLMADGSVRRVITFDDLTDDGNIGVSDFDATLANGLVSVSALTEWDGRVHWTKANQSSQTGTTEIYNCNLQYCALGKFGDVVTHNASEFLTSTSVSNKAATLSWNTAVTVAAVGGTNITVKLPANPNTDTKNTAGSTDTASKIFLIGATSQAANPQTYSHDTAYVGTDGCLYSGGAKVLTSHQSLANYVTLNTAQTVSGRKTFSDAIVISAYYPLLFNNHGNDAASGAYGTMFLQRTKYFNIVRTKKGASSAPSSDHGGSLMEINLENNAVSFAGVVTASNISTSSDARLKTRIADISLPIAEIAAAPLWRYRRKDTGVVDVGSTAQYWGAILPELTRTDEQGWMSLDYGKTALLASVSLARKADDHEARIKALEAENRALKKEIERIKAA